MNMHISISILRNTDVPRKRAEVPSIRDEANLVRKPGLPVVPEADTAHLSMTVIITAAGMNDSIDRAGMECPPKIVFRSIMSQK